MKVADPRMVIIQRELDFLPLIKSWFPEWEVGRENVICPWHEDTRGSLHISPDGRAYCHGCRACASNLAELYAKMENCSVEKAYADLYKLAVDPLPETLVDQYIRYLGGKTQLAIDARSYLKGMKRHLSLFPPKSSYFPLDIGLDPNSRRITLPIRDEIGGIVNIRYMGWLPDHKAKALNYKGRGEPRLYPINNLTFNRRVLLVEGEFDAIMGNQKGIPTITWTSGATSWNKKYEHLFRDKAVWLRYDNDTAGLREMELVKLRLKELTPYVFDVPPFNHKGKDLSDWWNCGEQFDKLREQMFAFKFPKVEVKHYCPACGQEVKQ